MIRIIRANKIIFLIIVIAAVLRLWDLGGTPIHLTNDEAALGYNAYSILRTGRDEHGQFLPIIFRSFNDWKPGLYVYTTIPSIAIFGLNEFAARLPGAISGVIAVWLIYLVVGELFRVMDPVARSSRPTSSVRVLSDLAGARRDALRSRHPHLAFFAALFLAISPWHIHFSRGAWEAGMALTLVLAGIYFFLRAMRDKPNWLVISALFFGVTLLTYQGAKLSTGIVVLGLVIFWWKKLILIRKRTLFSALLAGVIIASPVLLSIGTERAGRLEVFSIFSYGRPEKIIEQIITQGNETKKSLTYVLFHSEELQFAKGILGRWSNHYSARFLFFEGDWVHLNLSVPRAGVVLFLDILFLLAGIVSLSRLKAGSAVLFVAFWFLLAPLPAALSRDTLHAIRSLNLIIPLTIILAAGAGFLWDKVKGFRFSKFIVPVFSLLYIFNFIYFLDQYFVHMNFHNAKNWQYGYKQLVQNLEPIKNKYDQIIITQSYDQPYIYFLFYGNYDPKKWQSTRSELVAGPAGSLDALLVPRLDNFYFEFIDWHRDSGRHGALVVGTPVEIPPADSSDSKRFKVVDEIKYSNGQTAFRAVEVF